MSDKLFKEMLKINDYINDFFGNPYFIYNGTTYYKGVVPNSWSTKLPLEMGGYQTDLHLELTCNRYTEWGQPIFPNDSPPQPQQTITYNGNVFRVETVTYLNVINKQFGNGATIKIMGTCPNKGI